MPAYAGPEGVRIIREVWPMELVPRESDRPLSPKRLAGKRASSRSAVVSLPGQTAK